MDSNQSLRSRHDAALGEKLRLLGGAAIQWHQDRDDVALKALKNAAVAFAIVEEAE